jgi:integration host factor subunit alpha
MNITKKDLSISLKQEFNLSMEESSIFIDEFLLSLSKAINKNPKVKIAGFGTFTKFLTKPRVGRNPKTMDSFSIVSKQKIKFLPTKKLKCIIN